MSDTMKRTPTDYAKNSNNKTAIDIEVNKLLKHDEEERMRSKGKNKLFYLETADKKIDPAKKGTENSMTLSPSLHTIVLAKEIMSACLIIGGFAGLVAFFFLDKRRRNTILAIQTAHEDQTVGMLTVAPDSRTVLVFYPLLCITITSIIVGVWILGCMRFEPLKTIFLNEITLKYTARIMYYQVIVQSTFIVLTVMPLAGVVNVYELAFASALTWAEFLMYLHSDIVNIIALNNWEIVDSARNPVPNNPVATLYNVCPKQPPHFMFSYEPLLGAIGMHTFIYIIMMIHLIQSMSSSTYDTDIWFNVIVLLTLFLQYMIPLTKLLQMARYPYLRWFTVYKFTVMAIEIIEVANMLLLIVFLIAALW